LPDPRPKHVLLIDDDPLQLIVREQVLREAGFATSTAATGEAAVAALRAGEGASIDAVVTDHMLPGLGGAELVRAIRAARPQVPVLVVTGLVDAAPDYHGLNVEFRTKPFPALELIATLRTLTA